jgi:primosomal protein N' (replication factor Y)
MLAEVLTSAARWNSEQPLLHYLVPPELEDTLQAGQLVAIPYGERLVEGIVWRITRDDGNTGLDESIEIRPLHAILDQEPALLPHQRALAEWMAEYYVTPLAQVTSMMLAPGLMQRSQFVLRLSEEFDHNDQPDASLHLRALVGLLRSDGELDIAQLKKMLGPTRAREILKEIKAGKLISRDAQLSMPKARPRVKRIVRLVAHGKFLAEWRTRMSQQLPADNASNTTIVSAVAATVLATSAPSANGTNTTRATRTRKVTTPNPWAMETSTAAPPLHDEAAQLTQRFLAAVDLLERSEGGSPWTPNMLCKASGLRAPQLQQLVQDAIIVIETAEVRRNPLQGRTIAPSVPLTLTHDQRHALDCILAAETSDDGTPIPILLHGVTGSGKTEVYLQALAALIAQGKRGIVLVPEIALTTQAVQRVASRFPGRVAIIHSELSVGERYDEWRRIRSGQVDVVIGSRSALFSPLPELGIIIIDEEHEPAYKQGEFKPTYHARAAALRLGQILHIPVVLGSATPAVDTFYHIEQGHYRLVELPSRIGATLPPVEIVDLRGELHAGNTSIISRRLQEELEQVLQRGQQAILFLNRRGAASCVLCRECGFVALCDHCDIPLTYHSTERILLCHYCGKTRKAMHFCPSCQSAGIRYFGLGTEKVQETIHRTFPTARLLRWDRDTARNHHAHEALLDQFANRGADVLIGTQMIAKGLDLPGVTLVGVISADIALNLPDYSAPERAFTLLTQVAGRAGRGVDAGRVIIQTFNPQHFCIDAASRHDFHEFYNTEIATRRRYAYPPFRQFAKFTYNHELRQRCQNEALLLYERLNEWITRLALPDTDIVGPAPALMERLRGKYRWQMIVRGPDLHRLLRVLDAPGWEIDIDPVSTL